MYTIVTFVIFDYRFRSPFSFVSPPVPERLLHTKQGTPIREKGAVLSHKPSSTDTCLVFWPTPASPCMARQKCSQARGGRCFPPRSGVSSFVNRSGVLAGIVNSFISLDAFSPLRGFLGLFHGDSSLKESEKSLSSPLLRKNILSLR